MFWRAAIQLWGAEGEVKCSKCEVGRSAFLQTLRRQKSLLDFHPKPVNLREPSVEKSAASVLRTMAAMIMCLVLLSLYNLMVPSESVTPALRSQEDLEKFILYGGEQNSILFSKCFEDTRTVEGSLYSIKVSEDEEFVRFVPKETFAIEWTAVDLGDSLGTIQCAQKAFELGAYMFKFDVSCNVALTTAYDLKSEQACDGAATEAVYITTRFFNLVDGYHVLPFGESRGCYISRPEGLAYDGDVEVQVSEVELPSPMKCCPTADQGYCLVKNCVSREMVFCEGEARCEALGLPMASKAFFEDRVALDIYPDLATENAPYVWVNIQRIDNVFQWIPEMLPVPNSAFYNISEIDDYEFCAAAHGNDGNTDLHIHPSRCNNDKKCVICYEPTTTLPQCPANP